MMFRAQLHMSGTRGAAMLEFIRSSELQAFRQALGAAVVRGNARPETLTRTLTTPGEPVKAASIIWRKDLGLWAWLSEQPYDRRRWRCWFGLETGNPPRILQAVVEVNIEVNPKNRNVRGRALVDRETGQFYLGHRGGLGGGRGGQMSIVDFAREIRGFARDTIERDSAGHEDVFIVANLASEDAPND